MFELVCEIITQQHVCETLNDFNHPCEGINVDTVI